MNVKPENNLQEEAFFLEDLIGKKVLLNGKKIGTLGDLVAKDGEVAATITHILVKRPLGDPFLVIPWGNVSSFSNEAFIVNLESIEKYIGEPDEDSILLKDFVVDKKVLDVNNREVEVVYDIRLMKKNGSFYATAVDISRDRLLKRMKMGFLVKNTPEDTKKSTVPWAYIEHLEHLSSLSGDIKLRVLKETLSELPPIDLAKVLEVMDTDQRTQVFDSLDSQTAAEALDATEPRVQREILASTSSERVTQLFEHLSPVEIAEIISILPRDDAVEFQSLLKGDISAKVQQIITQYDIPASVMAMHRFLGFPGDLKVEDAFTRFRKEAPNSDVTMYIYIIDNKQRILGVIDINELLQADPKSKLEEIMNKSIVTVSLTTMRSEIEALFRKYHFRAIPIIDSTGKLVGVVREKDAFPRET